MWFHTFSTTVFKTVVKNVLNTYFTTVFKKAVKNVLDRQTLCFTVAIFFITKNNTLFQKTRTKLAATEANWRLLASPIVEKNMCIFLVVVVAVVVVVVVAEDIVEDIAEDMSENDAEDMSENDDDVDDDVDDVDDDVDDDDVCLLYTSPSPRDS